MASVSKPTSNYGGYDYKFVKKVRDDFICHICFQVFRDPHLPGCCGQRFCQSCLEHSIRAFNKKRCPHCRAEGEDFCHQRDLDMKRKVSSLDAHCPQLKDGCKWVGQVKTISDHDRICGYVYVVCQIGCGSRLMRKDKSKHENAECPDRKVTCEHCGKERGSYRWITEEHHKVCEKIVIVCPRGCGQKLSQKTSELNQHKEVCTHQPVSCPFEKVGCKERPIRSKVEEHQVNAIQQHLLLTMLSLQSERENSEFERKRNQVMVEKMRAISTHIDSLVPLCPAEQRQPLREIRSILDEQLFSLKAESDEVSLLVESYSKYVNEEWLSPPFYVHLIQDYGYKMCIGVLANGDVSLYLLKGEYDHLLQWPIRYLPERLKGWRGIQVTLINLKLKREMERSRTSNAGRLLQLQCFSHDRILECERIDERDGPRRLVEKIHICDSLASSSVDDTIELSLCHRFA